MYDSIRGRLAAGDVIVLDGATGTELQRRGVSMDPAAWCGPATLGNDDLLTQIHGDYIRAGSDVVTANTYASSRLMLTPAGFGDRVVEINTRAVEAALLARSEAGADDRIAVAGSLSHMVPRSSHDGQPIELPEQQISDAFHELAGIFKTAGADHIMLEMMYNPARTQMALDAALSTGLPVWFGASAMRGADGDLATYDDEHEHHLLAEVLDLIPSSGVDVAGVMHTGAEVVGDALHRVRSTFAGPLMAYPDSGFFEMPDWRFVDTIDPDRLQQFFGEWLAQGVQLIGGCCGLTIEHVEAAVRARAGVRGE